LVFKKKFEGSPRRNKGVLDNDSTYIVGTKYVYTSPCPSKDLSRSSGLGKTIGKHLKQSKILIGVVNVPLGEGVSRNVEGTSLWDRLGDKLNLTNE
jgi:hypothetical protein